MNQKNLDKAEKVRIAFQKNVPALLTASEIAAWLNVNVVSIGNWAREGKFPNPSEEMSTSNKRMWRTIDVKGWAINSGLLE